MVTTSGDRNSVAASSSHRVSTAPTRNSEISKNYAPTRNSRPRSNYAGAPSNRYQDRYSYAGSSSAASKNLGHSNHSSPTQTGKQSSFYFGSRPCDNMPYQSFALQGACVSNTVAVIVRLIKGLYDFHHVPNFNLTEVHPSTSPPSYDIKVPLESLGSFQSLWCSRVRSSLGFELSLLSVTDTQTQGVMLSGVQDIAPIAPMNPDIYMSQSVGDPPPLSCPLSNSIHVSPSESLCPAPVPLSSVSNIPSLSYELLSPTSADAIDITF